MLYYAILLSFFFKGLINKNCADTVVKINIVFSLCIVFIICNFCLTNNRFMVFAY